MVSAEQIRGMKANLRPQLSEQTKIKIIERWRFSKTNQIATLAIEFNCSQQQVNKLINEYLSSKIRS